MPNPYNGNAANVAGLTQVTVTEPADGDALVAASVNTAGFSRLADWGQRFINFILNLFSTANVWTAAQTFPAGSTIAQAAVTNIAAGANITISPAGNAWFVKDGAGNVWGQFFATATATIVNGSQIAAANSLPAGSRPKNAEFVVGMHQLNGTGAWVPCMFQITTAGNILMLDNDGNPVVNTDLIAFGFKFAAYN